jgi:hypothetical protein
MTEVTAGYTIGHVPHPDSSLDRTRRAAAQAAPVAPPANEPAEPPYVVATREDLPALGSGGAVVLTPAAPVQLLLPQDPRRRSAVVLAVDNDVYLATSKELAQAAAGASSSQIAAYLPAGIAIPISNRAAWWAAATTLGTSSRITVIISKDEE